MAGNRHARRRLRPAVVAVAMFGVVVLLPGVSQSAPTQPGQGDAKPSIAEVQRQVATLGRQLEQVTEQYNAATITLDRAKKTLARAETRRKKVATALRADMDKARTVASSTYRAGPLSAEPFGQFTSMMASGSPDDFLERLSALDSLSDHRAQTIDDLKKTQVRASQAASTASRAKAAAQQVAGDLTEKKAWIEKRLPEQKTLLAGLTAAQRQRALDAAATGGGPAAAAPAPASAPAPSTAATGAATGKAKIAIDAARSKLGSPYVWAAAGPDAFDCSGLTMWAWAQAGVMLPHFTGSQIQVGTPVSKSDLQPGDLVFFYPDVSHVGLYIGGGQMIHAPTTGDVVKIASIDLFPFAGATRVV